MYIVERNSYYLYASKYLTIVNIYWNFVTHHISPLCIYMYLSYGSYICVPRSQHVSAAIMAGPLFTKRTDLLPQDLVKSRSREMWVYTFTIALKVERHIGNAVEMSVKFQSDTIIVTSNLVASRRHEIVGKTSLCLVTRCPCVLSINEHGFC